jgi:hypothetical protein
MKHYRIRAIVKGQLFIGTVHASDLEAAFLAFAKKIETGEIKSKEGKGFYQDKRTLITYEELNTDGTTRADSGEVKSRTQVGQVSAGIKS